MSDIDIETEDRQQQLCYKSSLNGSSKNVEIGLRQDNSQATKCRSESEHNGFSTHCNEVYWAQLICRRHLSFRQR